MSLMNWIRNSILRKKQTKAVPSQAASNQPNAVPLSSDGNLEHTISWFQQQLAGCSDIVIHSFTAACGNRCALIYLRGMIDQQTIQENVLESILSLHAADANEFSKLIFDEKQLSVMDLKVLTDLNLGLAAVLNAHLLLLVDGDARIAELPYSSFSKRSIEEALNESVIRGPRDSFIENLEVNLTLLRRRLKTQQFKTEPMKIGTVTKTDVVVAYVDGICSMNLVNEVKRRLSSIEIDGVLGSSVLEESIEDVPYSPFPQLQYTERPDVVSAALLEGRVAILVDGTPIILIAPVTLFMLLQSAEDYYQRHIAASWIRWIRYFFLTVSLLLPSLYIAVTTFHPEMIPTRLLTTVAASREIVPFPALLEALLMELAFEALREASLRIPKSIGQSISIIGALIIGTAAVQAGIVSAAMVIIVSLTGIASFIIPHYDLGLSFRILRFPIMFLAGFFGLFGISCGIILIYIHLINLKSFGTPYLAPLTPMIGQSLKDTLLRVPWWLMKTRPLTAPQNQNRQPKQTRSWAKVQEENED